MSDLSSVIDAILPLVLLIPLALVILIVYVRLLGLRSFSKMTSFDFVTTVAIGSLLAKAVTSVELKSYLQAILAIGILFIVQYVLAVMRQRSAFIRDLISNQPVMLFRKGEFDENALASSRITKCDVWGKIREANALQIENVHAVVLEPTGDISVLHGESIDAEVLDGVAPSPLINR